MRLLVIAILALLNIAGPASAQGEPRFAPVIGNEAYSGFPTRLNNPKGGQPCSFSGQQRKAILCRLHMNACRNRMRG